MFCLPDFTGSGGKTHEKELSTQKSTMGILVYIHYLFQLPELPDGETQAHDEMWVSYSESLLHVREFTNSTETNPVSFSFPAGIKIFFGHFGYKRKNEGEVTR